MLECGIKDKDKNHTLWVGDIEPWMDDVYITTAFSVLGAVTTVKLARDRVRNIPLGYAFVAFSTHEEAMRVYDKLNGQPFQAVDGRKFRVNWAAYGMNPATEKATDVSIYVGNLDPTMNDVRFFHFWDERYSSIVAAKVIADGQGLSKGFGFVRFRDAAHAERALVEQQGALCGFRNMKVRPATQPRQVRDTHEGKQNASGDAASQPQASQQLAAFAQPGHGAYLGGFDSTLTEAQLIEICNQFGVVVRIQVFPDQGPFGEPAAYVEFRDNVSVRMAASILPSQFNITMKVMSSGEVFPALNQVSVVPAGPGPAVTNMTNSQAQATLHELMSQVPPHFLALLQTPDFVKAFSEILEKGEDVGCSLSAEASRWGKQSDLITDRPELFSRPRQEWIDEANDDKFSDDEGPRCEGRSLLILPSNLRTFA